MIVRTYPLRDLVRRARQLAGPDVPLPSVAAPPGVSTTESAAYAQT